MIDREAKVPITASAVELFQRALAIKAGGNTRRRKFSDLQLALHRELNLQPLHPFPLDLEADQPPPPWMTGRVPDSVLESCRRQFDAALMLPLPGSQFFNRRDYRQATAT